MSACWLAPVRAAPGMERADLLMANGAIFTVQGKAIAENAKEDVKVLVVGNPGQHQCLYRPRRRQESRPHQPGQLPRHAASGPQPCRLATGCQVGRRPVASIRKLVVWGNHSPTMYADYRNCTSNGASVKALINDPAWNNDVFLPTVGKRGAAIIEARGLSSAASAANAAIDHVHDWVLGSDDWVTMGVPSDGSYGIPEGIVFGFPCECIGGSYKIVKGLEIDAYSQEKINKTLKELTDEAEAVKSML